MDKIQRLHNLFNAESVAIVGISRKVPSLGQLVLKNLRDDGYTGKIFLINPKADEISGLPCYPSLQDVPTAIGLIIIITPRRFVLPILEEAISLEIPSAIVITAGFSEVSDEGKELESTIKRKVQQAGMVVVGPNSMGIFNRDNLMHASFSPIPVKTGSIGYLSQSGSILAVVQEYFDTYKLGFSKFISLGNRIDVNLNESLNFLGNDDSTNIIGCYIESFAEPKDFRDIVTPISQSKPIIAVKSGKTEIGARATTSHTGALAGEYKVIESVLQSSGVILADTIKQQILVSRFMLKYPSIAGGGVAIVTSAGGPGTLAADEMVEQGVPVAELSEETKDKLIGVIPPEGSNLNPVDIIADADEERHVNVINVLYDDPSVAVVVVIIVHPVLIAAESLLNHLEQVNRDDKPIICCYLGPRYASFDTDLIVYESTKEAAEVLKRVLWYKNWIDKSVSYQQWPHLDGLSSSPSVDGLKLSTYLHDHGFEYPKSITTDQKDQARAFVDNIEFPIVVKIMHEKFSHKSDVGGVILDISTTEQFDQAWNDLQQLYDDQNISDNRNIMIQEFIEDGIELAMGIFHDPMFGHMLMVGSGGIDIELRKDVQFGPSPLSRSQAKDMISSLQIYPMLTGFRSIPAIDIDKLTSLLISLDKLIHTYPSIKEFDINPLIIIPHSSRFVVVDTRFELH